MRLSIRARLFANVIVAGTLIVVAAGLALHNARSGETVLRKVYEGEMRPAGYLHDITAILGRIRAGLYGVLVDAVTPGGAINEIRGQRDEILELWGAFVAAHRDFRGSTEERELVADLDGSIRALGPLFDRIEAAYQHDDRAQLGAILRNDWWDVQIQIAAPLDRLVRVQDRHVREAYEESVARSGRLQIVSVAVLAAGLALLALSAGSVIRHINRRIGEIDASLARIAAGDLEARVGGARYGEMGRIADSLDRTVAALRRDRDQLEAMRRGREMILDAMAEGVYETDLEGVVTYANPAACRLLGLPAERIVGQRGHALFHHSRKDGSAYPEAECPMRLARDSGAGVSSDEEWFWRPDGSAFPVEFTSRPIVADGRTRGAVVVFRDIGERLRAEAERDHTLDELRASNAALEAAQHQLVQSEKMAAVGQLAAGVAHEINNPVGFVHSNLGTLEQYAAALFEVIAAYEALERRLPAGDEHLARVRELCRARELDYVREDLGTLLTETREGLTRVKKIVQDLREFSHAGGNEWQWADLHQGIASTLNIVHNELKYKAIVVREFGELPQVRCLPSQLNQVFLNLLVNAGQAIEREGIITVTTRRVAAEVCVEIADNGRGIAPEHLPRIFEPFFTTKPVGKGTGLGLSLSYGIVERHGGRIEVDSAPGRGSRFRVWLPVEPATTALAA